jgi:hypothetical protein
MTLDDIVSRDEPIEQCVALLSVRRLSTAVTIPYLFAPTD